LSHVPGLFAVIIFQMASDHDLPISTAQVAGIIYVRHHTWHKNTANAEYKNTSDVLLIRQCVHSGLVPCTLIPVLTA
jgi:hypothetical protein